MLAKGVFLSSNRAPNAWCLCTLSGARLNCNVIECSRRCASLPVGTSLLKSVEDILTKAAEGSTSFAHRCYRNNPKLLFGYFGKLYNSSVLGIWREPNQEFNPFLTSVRQPFLLVEAIPLETSDKPKVYWYCNHYETSSGGGGRLV